jgi:hypothetical protein
MLAAGFPVPGRTGYALSSLEKIQLAGRVRDGGGARTSGVVSDKALQLCVDLSQSITFTYMKVIDPYRSL